MNPDPDTLCAGSVTVCANRATFGRVPKRGAWLVWTQGAGHRPDSQRYASANVAREDAEARALRLLARGYPVAWACPWPNPDPKAAA